MLIAKLHVVIEMCQELKRDKPRQPSSGTLTPVKKKPRFSTEKLKEDSKVCFFCNDAFESELHRASTFTFDNTGQPTPCRARIILESWLEVMLYLRTWYTSRCNRFRAYKRQDEQSKPTQSLKADSIISNHIGGRLPMRCMRSFQNQFDRKQLFMIASY